MGMIVLPMDLNVRSMTGAGPQVPGGMFRKGMYREKLGTIARLDPARLAPAAIEGRPPLAGKLATGPGPWHVLRCVTCGHECLM
jgi:hypothetical protein